MNKAAYHERMPADPSLAGIPRSTRRASRAGRLVAVGGLVLTLVLAGCVPTTERSAARAAADAAATAPAVPSEDVRSIRAPRDLAVMDPLLRTAWEAWLLMELGRVRTGSYTTDVLLELALPTGVRWTVVAYGPDGYALAVTGDGEPTPLRVDPDGVRIGS